MVEGDIFREVEEELKREQYARLWDKYGYLVIGSALAIILSVAGFKFWNYQQAQQAQTYGERYTKALNMADTGDKALAQAELHTINQEGPRGYAMLSGLKGAALQAAEGKGEAAVGAYDKLATSSSVDPIMQDFARIQAAMLRVDKADEAEMKTRLSALADGKSSWRHSARELLGLSAFKASNMQGAETMYNRIGDDPQTPAGIRQRAQMMLSLIAESTAVKSLAKDPPKTPAKPAEAAPAAKPAAQPAAAGGKK